MEVRLYWQDGLRFLGIAQDRAIIIDTKKDYGGFETGPAPMELLLMALGSCTGMDVVSILKKMKVKIDGLEIDVSGKRRKDHPKYFTQITIVYRFFGADLPLDRIKHAIELSQEKYCPIAASLKGLAEIDYEIEVLTSKEKFI